MYNLFCCPDFRTDLCLLDGFAQLCQWMMLLDQFTHALVKYMGIDLGCRYVRMAQQCLHSSQIRPVL